MMSVAIQGIAGSYSEEAAGRLFGCGVQMRECASFLLTLSSLHSGEADVAVLPVRNKIIGEISDVAVLLGSGNYRVIDRLTLEIAHVLIGQPHSEMSSLGTVASHPAAIRQCSNFLRSNPKLTVTYGQDTASCVRETIAGSDAGASAIGSRRAAAIYGGKIIREDVADERGNWTDFVAVVGA